MTKTRYLIGTAIVPVVILLFFASLLGENHRAKEMVNTYIARLVTGDFSSSCIPVNLISENAQDTRHLSCEDKNFLFMVTLLSQSGMTQTGDVSFETHVNQYWLPFFTADIITVGLSYTHDGETTYFDNLFTLNREKWSWSVSEIRISDPQFSTQFSHYQQVLNLNQYVVEMPGHFELQGTNIELGRLSHVDKMVLKYNLQKLYKHLN